MCVFMWVCVCGVCSGRMHVSMRVCVYVCMYASPLCALCIYVCNVVQCGVM